jgi:hypothetical protein
VWGQERSSASKWRRHGSRTDERTGILLEIIGDLVKVEEIGIYTFPLPTHTHKKRQENGQEKQGYQQENKGINKRTSTRLYGNRNASSSSPLSRQLQILSFSLLSDLSIHSRHLSRFYLSLSRSLTLSLSRSLARVFFSLSRYMYTCIFCIFYLSFWLYIYIYIYIYIQYIYVYIINIYIYIIK